MVNHAPVIAYLKKLGYDPKDPDTNTHRYVQLRFSGYHNKIHAELLGYTTSRDYEIIAGHCELNPHPQRVVNFFNRYDGKQFFGFTMKLGESLHGHPQLNIRIPKNTPAKHKALMLAEFYELMRSNI